MRNQIFRIRNVKILIITKVRIRFKNHNSGHFSRFGQYNNPAQDNTSTGQDYNAGTGSNYKAVGSWLFLEEYGAALCTTADTA